MEDINPGTILLTKCSFEASHISFDFRDQNRLKPSKRTTIKIITIPKGIPLLVIESPKMDFYQCYPNVADYVPQYQIIFLYEEKLCHASSIVGWSDYFELSFLKDRIQNILI